ncbi:MAG: type II toxin-antitoxin system RelB/DinJ family antitoxin [Defluviitaleaceae bacterium]|nr:type II toxin-antitoxin system RelB/DinJ family antitoxin [Defluviitaleaceae bacterium]
MTTTTNVRIRVDVDLKKQAEELFMDLGLNMTEAMTIFLRQAVRNQGIPFEISRVPNVDTMAAMLEAERISQDPDVKGYNNLDELFKDLKS